VILVIDRTYDVNDACRDSDDWPELRHK
jgi:hypothetical protein